MAWEKSIDNTFKKANATPIIDIFRYYDLDISDGINYSCPFHPDRDPSFRFYADSNSFYCFSCNEGGGPVNFVAKYNKINKYEAAEMILNNFEYDYYNNIIIDDTNVHIRIYIEFSKLIREFILEHRDNVAAIKHADYICSVFDNIKNKYKMDQSGINALIYKLKNKLYTFN